MARLASTTLTGIALFTPVTAHACGFCVDADVFAMAPWFHAAGGLLVLWAFLNWLLKLMFGTVSPPPEVSGLTILARLVFFGVLVFLFSGVGLAGVIILLLPFVLVRLVREVLSPQLNYPNLGRGMAVAVAVLVILVAAVGIWWRAGMSPPEAFDQFSSTSTPVGKSRYAALGEDPRLQAMDLLPMLTSGEADRMSKAFIILAERGKREDLLELRETIIAFMPEEAPKGYVNWGDPLYHARHWFSALGLEDIETRADLEDRLATLIAQPTNE